MEGERGWLVEVYVILGVGPALPGEAECGYDSWCHQQRASGEGGRRRGVGVTAQEGREVGVAARQCGEPLCAELADAVDVGNVQQGRRVVEPD
ncbi:hypothetical protein AS594_01180 [Streptomyces agglomeratus]|uniref:Uncharacterized protein n=1 Tax=Streptomyces agglomeratus TaxID=285458 RepID=A0A1E5P1C6_9ACTN|nr:hypothetical protein AS594_01180 [Streptomyces agglomeratus]